MRYLTPAQFADRQLKNGEEYILIFGTERMLSLNELSRIHTDIRNSDAGYHLDITDEWQDSGLKYYVKVKIKNNPLWGWIIIAAFSAVGLWLFNKSLAEVFEKAAVLTHEAVPLALVGLVVIFILWGSGWLKRKQPV